eukprot:737732-Prymnesium_polylepis.1
MGPVGEWGVACQALGGTHRRRRLPQHAPAAGRGRRASRLGRERRQARAVGVEMRQLRRARVAPARAREHGRRVWRRVEHLALGGAPQRARHRWLMRLEARRADDRRRCDE